MYNAVFNLSLDWSIWQNYEVVEFHLRSGIATVLYCVAYFYVCTPFPPCYSITHRRYHTRSFTNPCVTRIWLRILNPFYASTISWFPLHDPPSPLSPTTTCFPRLCQIFMYLLLFRLLIPPCIPTVTSLLADLLACAHFKYRKQLYPLCYSCLKYHYVGYLRLRSRLFPHHLWFMWRHVCLGGNLSRSIHFCRLDHFLRSYQMSSYFHI